jgi:hypothetical protein
LINSQRPEHVDSLKTEDLGRLPDQVRTLAVNSRQVRSREDRRDDPEARICSRRFSLLSRGDGRVRRVALDGQCKARVTKLRPSGICHVSARRCEGERRNRMTGSAAETNPARPPVARDAGGPKRQNAARPGFGYMLWQPQTAGGRWPTSGGRPPKTRGRELLRPSDPIPTTLRDMNLRPRRA